MSKSAIFNSPSAVITTAVGLGVWSTTVNLSSIVRLPWTELFSLALVGLALVLVVTRAFATALIPKHPILGRFIIPGSLGIIAAGVYLVVVFAIRDLPLLDWEILRLPQRLWLLLTEAISIVQVNSAPLNPDPAVVFLLTGCGFALLLLADLLAHSRIPLLAIAPILTMWAPVIGLGRRIETRSLLITLFAVLLLFLATNQNEAQRIFPIRANDLVSSILRDNTYAWQRLGATGALLGVALGSGIIANHALPESISTRRLIPAPAGGTGMIFLGGSIDGFGTLLNQSTDPLFTYTTSNNQPVGNLRFATYSAFDGRQWTTLQPIMGSANFWGSDRGVMSSGIMFQFGPDLDKPIILNAAGEPIPTTEVSVQIETLSTKFLPVTAEPRQISVSPETSWFWDSANDQGFLYGGADLQPGDVIELTLFPRSLNPEILRNAPAQLSDDALSSAYPRLHPAHLHLPDAEREFLIETARQIVGDAVTNFDAAVMLQNYLRNPSVFTYSGNPPMVRSGNLVTDFLDAKEGYCVHFATTMVLLARALGIPARLAVGFQPGTQDESGRWTVTAHESHSWSELYFGPDIGWVAFEPTPGAISGPAPAYTTFGATSAPNYPNFDYLQSDWDFLRDAEAGAQNRNHAAAASGESAIDHFFGALRTAGPATWLIPSVLGMLAAGLIIYRVLAAKRQAMTDEIALRKASHALAKRGITIDPTLTPRQLPPTVAANWKAKFTTPAPENLVSGLTVIANSVEQTRYRGAENTVADQDLRMALKQVIKAKPEKRKV